MYDVIADIMYDINGLKISAVTKCCPTKSKEIVRDINVKIFYVK